MCSKVNFFHCFAVTYVSVKWTEKHCQWKDTETFWSVPFILCYFTAARAWNRLTLLSWIITKVQVNKDQAPCLKCQWWPWCQDYFFQSQASLFPFPFLRMHWAAAAEIHHLLLAPSGLRALLTWCQATQQCPVPWQFVGLQIPLPLKHTVLRWQEAAGSDSVLLSVEIAGICVWVVSAGCHNHSKDFHWV